MVPTRTQRRALIHEMPPERSSPVSGAHDATHDGCGSVVRAEADRRVTAASLHVVKIAEMLKLLADDGWTLKRIRGSHRQYVHPTKPGKVTVAGKASVTLPKGTAASILRQAGLKSRAEPPTMMSETEGRP